MSMIKTLGTKSTGEILESLHCRLWKGAHGVGSE